MYELYEKLLKKRNVRSADVSRATGISTSTLTDWKKGRSQIKADKIQKIADYFKVRERTVCQFFLHAEHDRQIPLPLQQICKRKVQPTGVRDKANDDTEVL